MERWADYIKSNSLKGEKVNHRFDCQLVTAINAAYHLKGTKIRQNSDYYLYLANLGGCEAGPCFDIKKVWKELGVWEHKRFMEYDLTDFLKPGCFIEVNIWHKSTGYHSCAIVDYVKKCDCIRVANFNEVTSTQGWMFKEDLAHYVVKNIDHSRPEFNCRTFKILFNATRNH